MIDVKEIIIEIAAVAYSVMILVRRFMTIRRFVSKFIRVFSALHYSNHGYFYRMQKLD